MLKYMFLPDSSSDIRFFIFQLKECPSEEVIEPA